MTKEGTGAVDAVLRRNLMPRRRFALLFWLWAPMFLLPLSCGRRASPGPAALPPGPVAGQLVYTQIDVGQGDSELIVSPDGHAMLVDAGLPGNAERIMAVLRERGVTRLDLAVASHPHNDHIGSMDDIVRQVLIGQFLDSGFNYGSAAQRRLLEALKERHVPFKLARPGQSYPLGERVTLAVLAPRDPLLKGTDSDPNNNSVVLKVLYGGVRILLTGDMEEAERERLYADNADLAAEVYKVAHHGSHNGTDRELLERVRPRVALISCAVGNDYHHPHAEALEALASAQVAIYRTDLQGTITLTTDGRSWQVRTEKQATIPLTTPGREISLGGRLEPRAAGGTRTPASREPADVPRARSGASAAVDGAQPAAAGGSSGPVSIIGNLRTKVYHVGRSGRLPAPANRVYFRSEAEARRAGYRPAGAKP
jgi:competence protein ComEC